MILKAAPTALEVNWKSFGLLRSLPAALPAVAALLALAPNAAAELVITPTFDSSITGNGNATAIERAVNSAISTLEGLYSNTVNIPVTFTYDPAAAGNLLSTSQEFYGLNYSTYKTLLQLDSNANPNNTVLSTAIANLSKGNDANGSKQVAVSAGLLSMLEGSSFTGNAVININSNVTNFSLTRPVSSGNYDLIGGLEHELDEVLGGGGAGSTLNSVAGSCVGTPSGFFCNKVGPTDLYRYSAANTPSFTTSSGATPYYSINGGVTDLVGLNQNSSGDYGDFSPAGSGAGQLIQNAFNTTGQDEAYTVGSPEYEMLESIGWDATPEPGTWTLLGTGLALMLSVARRRRNRP